LLTADADCCNPLLRMSFLALLVIVAPVFLIVVAGYVVRRAEWLSAEADASLLRLGVNLLFPCLILDTILGNPALANAGNLLLAPVVGFATVVLGFAVAWIAAPAFGVREAEARRTFAFSTGFITTATSQFRSRRNFSMRRPPRCFSFTMSASKRRSGQSD
jgi:predicted permease